ncbi:MAG: class I SAM-dependent methyltransferase [Pirellulales bacterium]
MSLAADLKTLAHLALSPIRGQTHAERLESFYSRQAAGYDAFRARLLHGRQELYEALPAPTGGLWLELGGGTGENLERLGPRLKDLRKAYVVDLAPSLLSVARQRIARHGWGNVSTVEADVTQFAPADGPADVATFSYSLTMIPDWFAAIDRAIELLRPGGHLGVVDFYVARKHPTEGRSRHGSLSRAFWPWWFAHDNVFPSADHLPYLTSRLETVRLVEGRSSVPYLPGVRVPYYWYVGRKR